MLAISDSAKPTVLMLRDAAKDWEESWERPTGALTCNSPVPQPLPHEASVPNEQTMDWLGSQEFPVRPYTHAMSVRNGPSTPESTIGQAGRKAMRSSNTGAGGWSDLITDSLDLMAICSRHQQIVELHPIM